jgi:hypothetical protein
MVPPAILCGAKVAGLANQHERTAGELESLGERRISRASGIIRSAMAKSAAAMVRRSMAGALISPLPKFSLTVLPSCAEHK